MQEKSPLVFDERNKAKKWIHYNGATGNRKEFYITQKEVRYVKL